MEPRPAMAPAHPDASRRYYDERFAGGYVEHWPAWKRARVAAWVRALALPERGAALDFGCGNGVFTRVLAEALPRWSVTGCDISGEALRRARERVPQADFADLEALLASGRRFDLVFSHHVLEHVVDLEASLERMGRLLADDGAALHVLPCGNPGSLEHEICRLRRDGFEPERGGRFFFEDPGHLRRLASDALAKLCARQGLDLVDEAYAGQWDGAIEWITREGTDFVRRLLDPAAAMDAAAARRLRGLRRRLLPLAYLRRLPGRRRGLRRAATLPLRPLARLVDRHCRAAAEREWSRRRRERGGSEMYLFFSRRDGGAAC